MNKLTLLPVLLRERFSQRSLTRKPEPDLVMDDPQQVATYDEAGSIDGLMSSAYLFHTARRCLPGVHRMVRADGALYLVDFTRLKNEKTVKFFIDQNADSQPPLFTLDYERSLSHHDETRPKASIMRWTNRSQSVNGSCDAKSLLTSPAGEVLRRVSSLAQ